MHRAPQMGAWEVGTITQACVGLSGMNVSCDYTGVIAPDSDGVKALVHYRGPSIPCQIAVYGCARFDNVCKA